MALAAQGRAATGASHPVIQEALQRLEQAKLLLTKEAANDFQGHKAKAVQEIDQAIQELGLALQTDKQ
jgi:hypothetical protein